MKVINLEGFDIEFPDTAKVKYLYGGKYKFAVVGNLEFYTATYTGFNPPHTVTHTLKCRVVDSDTMSAWRGMVGKDSYGEDIEMWGESSNMSYWECVEDFKNKIQDEISELDGVIVELKLLIHSMENSNEKIQ